MQRSVHPLLVELQLALASVVPTEPVNLIGEWRTSRRVTYLKEEQTGFGSGRRVEIEDSRWTGALVCSVPIVCMAFLRTPDVVFWAKSLPASAQLPVEFSVHAYAGYMRDRATFASIAGGAHMPSLAVPFTGDVTRDVRIEVAAHATGRLAPLVHLDDVDLMVYLLPGNMTTTGRKRIWHLRREVAAALPEAVGDMFTHGRSGRIRGHDIKDTP